MRNGREELVISGTSDHSGVWTVPSVSSFTWLLDKGTCILCGLSSAFNYVSGFVSCALCSPFDFYLETNAATMRIKRAPDRFPFLAFPGICLILLTVFKLLLLSVSCPKLLSFQNWPLYSSLNASLHLSTFPLYLSTLFPPLRNPVSVRCLCQPRTALRGSIVTSLLWAAASQ